MRLQRRKWGSEQVQETQSEACWADWSARPHPALYQHHEGALPTDLLRSTTGHRQATMSGPTISRTTAQEFQSQPKKSFFDNYCQWVLLIKSTRFTAWGVGLEPTVPLFL